MEIERTCIYCGIGIDRPFWLCQSCEDYWDVASVRWADWPEELKALHRPARRYEDVQIKSLRGDIVSIEFLEELGAQFDEMGNVYGLIPRGEWRGWYADYLMAYAPFYENEPKNRQYRRANDIVRRKAEDWLREHRPAPLIVPSDFHSPGVYAARERLRARF